MKRIWKQIGIVLCVLIVIAITVFYVLKYTTYSTVQVLKTYESGENDDRNYIQYLDGVLKYSKDGIVMLTKNGEELWNQPCQMNRPMVEVNNGTAVVADKEGRSILVFQKNGLKGEIQTTRPIEKIAVSTQGIVAAVLQDGKTPWVMCYDSKGAVLVEHKASFGNTGYPIDISLSNDGNVLLVSYLNIDGSDIVTKAVYYHFGKAGEEKTNHQVAHAEYKDMIIPSVKFLDKNTSLLVSDHAFILYEGLDEPKQTKIVELDKEIKSVAYDEDYIVFVLKNSGQTNYELRLYRTNGEQVMTTEFEGEYSNIKIAGKEIVLYSGDTCAIFNEKGVCKFQGTLENNIMELFPIAGLNKYMLISANGFSEIQLAK